ncbi:gluconate 2-dehydrogenase subunit 3 family protein [Alteromonas aestuariivivens]|uniref:Gluconate 2-dehydrogenase subunit 3 family protein n=1 Tax=Alteromonas aestuariivivens TaxID=1938339 RepID=A0A3D8M754_9ALTE|nr:gluconate 2-dehydrogenase subunit 3 family protein [Alteromonas aestuariivivens]RDV25602.1 gluconate 2-dehydrogenase subunit 3 family protein [Alteromonas aestuariivivens]
MERRELLKLIAAATGTAFVGGAAFAYEQRAAVNLHDTGFSELDVAFLNEVGDVILPKTDTPGAKEANVGAMMVVFAADCYTASERQAFRDGLTQLNSYSKEKLNKDFLLLTAEQKLQLLTGLDTEARRYNAEHGVYRNETARPDSQNRASPVPVPHYFTLFKQLTLYSFFTSQIGATKVLRYSAIPGRYDGDMPYQKGDRAWAT